MLKEVHRAFRNYMSLACLLLINCCFIGTVPCLQHKKCQKKSFDLLKKSY